MKRLGYILLLLLALAAGFTACDKAPSGIIKESKMEDLLVDIYKAQAYIDNHPDEFDSDSSRQAMKQAVFNKYHITQADYDTSLVWYAHNIETYDKVYKKVIDRLGDEQKKLQKQAGMSGTVVAGQYGPGTAQASGVPEEHKRYGAKGDTANVWKGDALYMIFPGMNCGYIKFDLEPDAECKSGDRYQLNMKLLAFGNDFNILLAVDYADGSTSFMNRTTSATGWFTMDLQTDTGRVVDRVYGYLRYDMRAQGAAFVDSIQLLRTHLSLPDFGYIGAQKFISPNKNARRPGQSQPPGAMPQLPPARPVTPQRMYAPKPGVNKGGIDHHGRQPFSRPESMR